MKNPFQSNEPALPPEQQILINSARLELDDIAKSGIKSIILNNPNWHEILALSAQYGTQPLLNKHLSKDAFSQHIPDQVLKTLNNNVSRLSLKCHLIHSELSLFLEAVILQNIPVILLKGSFLANSIYRNISLRPMGDIDILCKKKDIERIQNLLIKKGYSQSYRKHITHEELEVHLSPYIHPNGAIIEVHTDIFPQLFCPEEYIENIWEHICPCESFATPVYSLSNEHLLLFLITHLYKHFTGIKGITLYWLCDIHEVVRQLGDKIKWDRFFKDSDLLNTAEAVSAIFQLIQAEWRTPMPETVVARVKDPIRKIPVNKIFSSKIDARMHYKIKIKYLWEIKGWKNKIKYCFCIFFPVPDYIIQEYQLNDHSFVLAYYLRHPFDVLWRAVKRLIMHRN